VLAGSSNNIIVERTFVRYVDASSFVKSVISKVVGTAEANLPAPVDGQGRELTEVGRDSLQVVDAVAASFISVHSTLAFNQYPRAFGDQPYKGGWLKALKYYFEWMWNWLRRQPGDILQRKVRNLKLATAKSIQGMLGTNSQIMVAVGGLTAHDNPNGIPPMANEVIIQTFSRAQQDVLRVPEPPRPLELWKDFSEVAMSLIDGSKITNDKISMPEQSESLSRRVVTNPNHVTPNYRKRQFLIPASLDVACKGQRLSSSDPLTALMVQKSLALSLSSGTAKNENIDQISTLEQRLDKWRNENNSFVWIVGNRIAEGITNALDAWEAIGRRVVDVNEDGLVAAEERAQKALTRLFGVSFAMIAVALVGWLIQALWVYNTSKIWPPLAPWWPKPASAVAIVVLIWNLIGVGVVYQAAKHLFQIQHKLQSDEVQSLEKEKTHIMTEIIRLTHFYRQYQAWVAIISSFVHRPDAKPESEQSDAMTGRGIPQSMTVARLIPNITGNEGDLAKKVANEYYQTGWLNKLMQEVLNKQVADFNEITHDNLGNSSYPLAKAMDWATSDSVTDAIKAHSVDQIQKLATQGTAYQSWKVQLTNALGHDQVVTGSEIIGQLRAGTGYMPQSVGFTPQGSVRDAAKLSNKNSACAFDERLGLSSEFSRNITVKQNLADSRELDFLGLRFEATELLSPSDVKIFQTAGGATPANEQSSLSEAVRPDSIA
jgi:hypothetical protein